MTTEAAHISVDNQFNLYSEALPLTARELEIASLVALALSNRQIASRIFISEKAVESAITIIKSKLNLPNRTAICRWYIYTHVIHLYSKV